MYASHDHLDAQVDAHRTTLSSAFASPADQAFRALQVGFVVAPVAAGLDKFFDVLVDWPKYLAPQATAILPVTPQQFMYGVGVIEIAAGLAVAARPRIGGYVVAGWLAGIVGNMVIQGRYLDIALRDVGLMIGAFALGRLADAHHRGELGQLDRP